MTQKYYKAIKDRFDADATLVTAVFDKLYAGRPDPENITLPICVLEPSPDVTVSRTMSSIYHTVTFRLVVEDKTMELVGPYLRLIQAAFKSAAVDMSVSGLQILYLEQSGEGLDQTEEDTWLGYIEYQSQFAEERA